LKLFQSIFGGGESQGRYPESLIGAAIERALDGTDPRLRLLSGYRKRLREPILHAIDHVVVLVDKIQAPVPAGHKEYSAEPRLAALFASAKDMLDIFGRDAALAGFLAGPEGFGAGRVTALLLAQRLERNILGMDLTGDQVRRDVRQVTVSFAGHRLLDPSADEEQMRRQLKRRAFDHLLSLALAQISERSLERDDLKRQRDLLRRKLMALEHGGWSFEPTGGEPHDQATLLAEIEAVTEQLNAIDAGSDVLEAHLGIVTQVLGDAEHQLRGEGITLHLDAMNIQRPAQDQSARKIHLQELYSASGRRAVMLPIALAPHKLPPREDFVTAAQRYL